VLSDGPAFVALLKDGNFEAAKELGPDAYEALQMTAGLFLEMQDSLDAVPDAEALVYTHFLRRNSTGFSSQHQGRAMPSGRTHGVNFDKL
jgi:hypothetical protein